MSVKNIISLQIIPIINKLPVFKDSYTEMLSGNSLNGSTTLEPYQVIVATEGLI
jgi:hypothetical protein